MTIRIARLTEVLEEGGVAGPDELRVLVDRLWPRGVRKEALAGIRWMPEVAPGTALRRWYGHDPARWEEFRRRYFAELDARPQAAAPLLDAARRGRLLLLTASRDLAHSNAAALADWLKRRLAGEGDGG